MLKKLSKETLSNNYPNSYSILQIMQVSEEDKVSVSEKVSSSKLESNSEQSKIVHQSSNLSTQNTQNRSPKSSTTSVNNQNKTVIDSKSSNMFGVKK